MLNPNQSKKNYKIYSTLFFFGIYFSLIELILSILLKVNPTDFSPLADFYQGGGLISNVIASHILWYTPEKSLRNSILYTGALLSVLTLYLVIGMTNGMHGRNLLQGYLFMTIIPVTVMSIIRFTVGLPSERKG